MPFSSKPAHPAGALVALFPELAGAGGIQRGCRHIAAVLAGWAQEKNWSCRFLSLNDPAGQHSGDVAEMVFEYEGFARSKGRFAQAAAGAEKNARLALATHPNLAPVAWGLKKKTGAKMAVVAWGIDVWTRLPLHRRWPLRRADAVLAISRYTASELARVQGMDPTRVRLLPLALDPAFWERSAQPAGAVPRDFPSGRVVLSVARLAADEGYKGVDTVIEAMPQIVEQVADAHYVVVGDGDDRPRLEAISRQLGVSERVHFLGQLDSSSSELMACYANCDVFALPSKGEGFGLVFLEAMAFGKPVVGGAHGGTPDVIEDGATGFLVPHGDSRKLASLLIALLKDADLRAAAGRRARHRVEREFLFEHFRERLRGIVEELCAS